MADIADAVHRGLQVVANLPDEAHWLCERVEPGPGGKEVAVEYDEATRADSTIHALMLLSFSDQEANQQWLKGRIDDQLVRCPHCVEGFYTLKRRFYQRLLREHGQDNIDAFFEYLQDWDIERVKPVVYEVAKNLEQSNSPNEWLAKFRQNKLQSNAIHECFSNPTMLIRDMELNTCIKRLCSVPRFEIRGPAIALVSFLFSEDEELRNLAERSWKVQGPRITVAIFENNLLESLESATRRAQEQANPEKLNLFFRGLSVIVHNVDKNVIMKCISGAERDPIKVAVHKLQPNPPFWHSVLGLFQALMLKLGQDVWEVISPLTPSGFGDVIFNDRLFSSLLRSTEQGIGGESQLLDLTEWMSEYIDSIEPLLRPTTAPVLIRQIFRNDLPALSRGLCFKEGMKILNSTLKAVESGTRTGNVLVRQAYDLFLEHEQIVLDVAFSTQTFEDELMEKHMLVAQRAALETVAAALKLNLLFFAADSEHLHRKNPEKPPYQMNLRNNLWRVVAEKLPLNVSHFYIQVLQAIRPITELDAVYVSTREETLREDMQQFNARLADIDKPLANVMKSISRCSLSALDDLMRNKPSCEVIISLMMARSEDVAMSAEEITLAAQGAEDRVDALRLMLVKDFSIPIPALTSIARQMCRFGLFAMMPRWVNISASVLDLLCDRTEGMIRKSDMEPWARAALRVYWETQWRCLGTIFRKSRRWALSEDKTVMIEFLRDSMDYAEGLFDNFWTFEQALHADIEEIKEQSREESWSNRLLHDASRALNPFTTILGIQDPHLLRTCQQLMCKILGLLAEKHVALEDRVFFLNLKKYLYPESFEDYDSSKSNLTNLTETQKTELAFAAERLSPGFVPTDKPREVIELSDDDYSAFEIPDEDMLKAADIAAIAKKTQTKLEFRAAPRPDTSRSTTPKQAVPSKVVTGPLRTKKPQDDPQREAFLRKRKADQEAEARRKAAARAAKQKATTADSSEDSSSEEEEYSGLFKLADRTRRVLTDAHVVEGPKRGQPRKVPRIIKPVKDTRARVPPDMSPLFKRIFKWDFFHDGAFPPGLSASSYTSVAKSFKAFGVYQKTFEPLLLLEAWQSFLKCKEEAMPSGCLEVKISSRMRSDHFVELETTIDSMPDRNRWFEADVILLSTNKDPLHSGGKDPHCIARVHTMNRKFTGKSTASLRCDPGPIMLQNHMRNGGTLYGIKIMSLTPLEREYAALVCMQYYDLREEILTAKPSALAEPPEDEVKKTEDLYNCNAPQANAIISAVTNTGFTLIQGPPGTGKTKTVIGIVSAILAPKGDRVQASRGPKVSKGPVKKILVCAPSNAAVDELVIRFKRGLRGKNGEMWTPQIVRLGRSDAINSEVKDVTLEELIEARVALVTNPSAGAVTNGDDLRQKHTKTVAERNTKQQQLDDARAQRIEPPAGLLVEIERLNASLRDQRRGLDQQRDQRRQSSREAERLRLQFQQEIMNESEIICATLSGSGHEMLRNVNVNFETVIIDEAAQSVELSALIPLKFGCDKCILVGDPQQLPPTVLSRQAAKFSYEKSLFVRMQENYPQNVHLLSIQYRMHPAISAFPSREFYNSNLTDGKDMAEMRRQPWHSSTIFGSYRFFNVAGSESRQKTSLINAEEAKMALALFMRLAEDFREINFDGRIGIVTPYRQQLGELKRVFQGKFGEKILTGVEFNTVDAFQGRERDIIIFSCVRAAEEGGVGFLSDVRRMNVGLTRAKSSLFILGNAKFLVRNHMWSRLVEDAKQRNFFTENTRRIFDRSSRTLKPAVPHPPPPQSSAPKRAPAGGAQQVAPHWDPMDIDLPEAADPPLQNPPPPQGPSGNIPHLPPRLQQHPDNLRGTSQPRDVSQGPPVVTDPRLQRQLPQVPLPRPDESARQQQSRDEHITCHTCGQKGHRQINCPKNGHSNMNEHNVRMPDQRPPPPQLKRPAEFEDPSGNKRIHSAEPSSSGPPRPSSINESGDNGSEQKKPTLPQAPIPPKKGVIQRKSNADVFLRKKPKRPPQDRPSN